MHIHMFPYNVWLAQSAALSYNRLSQRIINLKETYGPAFMVNFFNRKNCLNGPVIYELVHLVEPVTVFCYVVLLYIILKFLLEYE